MISHRSKSRGTSVIRCLVFAVIMVTLVSSLSTGTPNAAAAPECPEGYVLSSAQQGGGGSETSDECVPISGQLEVQDQTEGAGTQIDTEADLGIQAPGEPAYVTVHAYTCEGDADWVAQDLESLRNQCDAAVGSGFYLVNAGPDGAQNYEGGAQTDSDGLAFWTIELPGTVVISTMHQDVAGSPIVYCGFPNGIGLQFMPEAASGMVSHPLEAGQQLYCDWFSPSAVSAAGEETGSLTVYKLVCPPMLEPNGEAMLQLMDSQVQNLGPRKNTDSPGEDAELCTEFEAEIGEGFTFSVTLDGQDLGSKSTDATGQAVWTEIPSGELVITEIVPDGYGVPFFYCHAGRAPFVAEFTNPASFAVLQSDVVCIVVNVPEDYDDGDVLVYKWECEENPGSAADLPSHLEASNCELVDGIEFSLNYGLNSSVMKTTGVGFLGGRVAWPDVPAGQIEISENVPDGYGTPVIYCASELPTSAMDQSQAMQAFSGPVVSTELDPGEIFVCHWINLPEHDTSITIYKYTCPEGYDPYGDGADPVTDCPYLTNNVRFDFHGDNYDDPAVTGESQPGDGVVTWGFLPAGGYTIVETPPAGTQSAFVLNCEGNSIPMIQSYPLSTGYELYVEAASGDHIVCYWYNIPVPDWGTVTVIKYACPQAHFVKPADCQIWEGGVEFELIQYVGSGGVVAGTGTTNSSGILTWTGLAGGAYELNEIGREWCYAEASRTDDAGNIDVVAGHETTVWVYNCGVVIPVKTPVKYPNTGVAPAQDASRGSPAPVSEQGDYLSLPHNRIAGLLDSRIVASMSISGPAQIEIASIGVVAEIETLEIVDGAFQDPTTSDMVSWYLETGIPGDSGNMVLAGHLNYWGDPEGVFFALDQVKPGDIVEITGQDGIVHQYEVQSVDQLDATAETLAEITDSSGEASLTLITCGGQWDGGSQTYLQRTVVRAQLVG